MEFEIVHKKAQDQIDQILAEVARLSQVAKDIEKSNIKADEDYVAKKALLDESIKYLSDEKAIFESNVAKVKSEFLVKQGELTGLKADVQALLTEVSDLQGFISEKRRDITSTEEAGVKVVKKYEAMIEEKKTQLTSVEKKTSETERSSEEELTRLKTAISKAENEIAYLTKVKESAQTELDRTTRETKRMINEAELAEAALIVTENGIAALETEMASLQLEKTTLLSEVEPLRVQISGEKEQLKALTKERIQTHEANREIIARLDQRESTLKERYEEVGLEYKG